MTSIFENTKSKVIIHLLHDDTLTEENRKKFIRTAEKYSQGIDFVDVSERKKNFSQTAVELARRKCTIGSLYRLFIPEVLNDVSKIIYLDCDIVVNLDIKEMWDIDINSYCMAGVHCKDFEFLSEAVRDKLNGSSCKTFINAGVMLMNLDKIRERGNLFWNSMAWVDEHIYLMRFSDQDIINNLFHGSIKLINPKFNNSNPREENMLNNSIIHTPTKNIAHRIWSLSGLPSQKLYWKYYLKSAWGENKSADDMINILFQAASKSSIPAHSYKQYLTRVCVSTFRKLLWTNPLAEIIRYILIYTFLKIKRAIFR